MALPADFNKIFGSTATGGLTPIGDVNYAKGWEFVGSNPPTKNDFSYLQNLSDLKSQWLYSNKLQRANPFGDIKSDGTTPTALENLGLGDGSGRLIRKVVFTASGQYIWPSGVKRIDVIVTGGGGGGGGCQAVNNTQTFSGAGGGAGGTVIATINATDSGWGPKTYSLTVGLGGIGYTGADTGADGGNSVFNSIVANGGKGGVKTGTVNTSGGAGGGGSGGTIIFGGYGGDGQASASLLTPYGGASYWGGGGRAGAITGITGQAYGAGGGGGYDSQFTGTIGKGGNGADGIIVIMEYA